MWTTRPTQQAPQACRFGNGRGWPQRATAPLQAACDEAVAMWKQSLQINPDQPKVESQLKAWAPKQGQG